MKLFPQGVFPIFRWKTLSVETITSRVVDFFIRKIVFTYLSFFEAFSRFKNPVCSVQLFFQLFGVQQHGAVFGGHDLVG